MKTDYEKFVYMSKMWFDLMAGDVFESKIKETWKLLRKEGLVDTAHDWYSDAS